MANYCHLASDATGIIPGALLKGSSSAQGKNTGMGSDAMWMANTNDSETPIRQWVDGESTVMSSDADCEAIQLLASRLRQVPGWIPRFRIRIRSVMDFDQPSVFPSRPISDYICFHGPTSELRLPLPKSGTAFIQHLQSPRRVKKSSLVLSRICKLLLCGY